MDNRILISVSIILLFVISGFFYWLLPSKQTMVSFDKRLAAIETALSQILKPTQAIAASQANIGTNDESARLQHIEAQMVKLESIMQMLSNRANDGQAERLQHQERATEQPVSDRQQALLAAQAQTDSRLVEQETDLVWSGAKEEDMWIAYEQALMRDGVELNNIECRVDSCILDFNLPPASDDLPLPRRDLEDWVFANAGNCGYTIEGSAADEFEVGSSRRVWLHDCE